MVFVSILVVLGLLFSGFSCFFMFVPYLCRVCCLEEFEQALKCSEKWQEVF
jgi:hypothetical protein